MRSPLLLPRRCLTFIRYLLPAVIIAGCISVVTCYLLPCKRSNPSSQPLPPPPPLPFTPTTPPAADLAISNHPIDYLVRTAESSFTSLLDKHSHSLSDAAARYRDRRGRHPPPGFDAWYDFANKHDSLVIEEFWDQIYHDLEPFWAVDPGRIRKDAWDFEMRLSVRNGTAKAESEWFWTRIWLDLVKRVEHLVPDVDLPLNAMDEPRVVVPWEEMDGLLKKAERTKRRTLNKNEMMKEFEKRREGGPEEEEKGVEGWSLQWEREGHYWDIARRGCPPSALARHARVLTNFSGSPTIASPFSLSHTHHGFVANVTLAADFCNQPDLQGLNGIFVEPLTVSTTRFLTPVFGGSKLSVNNDIILPAPMYWSAEPRFVGTEEDAALPWKDKLDKAAWRGVATRGHNTEANWRAFHRHRFVAMNNGSALARAENGGQAENFALPACGYGLKARKQGHLGRWIDEWTDVRFINLMCDEEQQEPWCNYTDPWFELAPPMTMAEQFRFKYLPDVDGNSFSGRYLGFLRSTSLPIKATLWREWHDSRLVAWKHFVPMDNRYGDWYAIMEYFLGYHGKGGRDGIAERLALAGREWASRVLRKEDMEIYVLRLLLEYARVSDDRRENMGWVEDL